MFQEIYQSAPGRIDGLRSSLSSSAPENVVRQFSGAAISPSDAPAQRTLSIFRYKHDQGSENWLSRCTTTSTTAAVLGRDKSSVVDAVALMASRMSQSQASRRRSLEEMLDSDAEDSVRILSTENFGGCSGTHHIADPPVDVAGEGSPWIATCPESQGMGQQAALRRLDFESAHMQIPNDYCWHEITASLVLDSRTQRQAPAFRPPPLAANYSHIVLNPNHHQYHVSVQP